ncbi:hypothetical protein [Microbacterium sp. RURRCA19A]|uniref:hypothetical protein n=1 Tax=Microbacterium sp. RURRCA19A TaxID=1907391 RepID=UPI00095582B4|nr:hypothetical protein [Microbacterium sp. RURRCA19A]SIS16520.1 hypothetical protein SAMN05880568_3222 [Microbacterium sp. RURRCA19A]
MLLTIGLAVMCVGVAFGVVGIALPRASAPLPFTTFVQYAVMAGIFSIGSTVMYVVHRYDGARLALVVGDATMVLAAGTMAVALAGLSTHRRRAILGLVAAIAVAVGAATASTSEDVSLVVKAAVLAVVCSACALAAARSPVAPRRPALLIASAMGLYAVYSAARALVGATTGWMTPVGAAFRSLDIGSAVAIATVLVCGLGIVLALHSFRQVSDDGPREHSVVVIGDAPLAASAFGADRLRSLVTELRTAAHALDDRAVDVRHGVATALPSALSTLGAQMHDGFGWSPEEIALLMEGEGRRGRTNSR